MTNDNEARVHDAGDEDEHAWATAATNYLQAYSIMQTAMSDGVNVHGAISGLLAAKDALRSLAASATQVPQGWKLVPVEPTEEMLVHGQEAWLAMWRSKPSIEDCKEAENTYKAMLSASPPAPQAATQGEAVAWQRLHKESGMWVLVHNKRDADWYAPLATKSAPSPSSTNQPRHPPRSRRMDDRELLEMAAKAAGIRLAALGETSNAPARIWDRAGLLTVFFYSDHRDHPMCRKPNRPGNVPWNPLTDDGDALRLAVKLEMGVSIFFDSVEVAHADLQKTYMEVFSKSDPYAATRRAIVRAAAEIGRTM